MKTVSAFGTSPMAATPWVMTDYAFSVHDPNSLFPASISLSSPEPTANSLPYSLTHSHFRRTCSVQVSNGKTKAHLLPPGVYTLAGESDAKPISVQTPELFQSCLGKGSHSACDRDCLNKSIIYL